MTSSYLVRQKADACLKLLFEYGYTFKYKIIELDDKEDLFPQSEKILLLESLSYVSFNLQTVKAFGNILISFMNFSIVCPLFCEWSISECVLLIKIFIIFHKRYFIS